MALSEQLIMQYRTVCVTNIIIFPGIVTSFELSEKEQITAAREAQAEDAELCLAVRVNPEGDENKPVAYLGVCIVAKVVNLLRLTNGHYQVMVQGLRRAERMETELRDDVYLTVAKEIPEDEHHPIQERRVARILWTVFEDYLKYIPNPSNEILEELKKLDDPGLLADFLARNFLTNYEDRASVLLETNGCKRAELLSEILGREIAVLELDHSIQNKVKYRLAKQQREIYLREQMNTIRSELGMDDAEETFDDDDYSGRIRDAKLPQFVEDKLLDENAKLQKIPYGMAEGSVIQNYLDTCLELPWNRYTKDCLDLDVAQKVLDEDHDGIRKVKERILEFLSVRKLNPKTHGQILCLVGPPGVGKTSVAKSIARATNRKFARIALGGIRDEAEIRGHRKTYVGAMPGRIINALKIAGSANPVILLDELDKLASDIHGDPSSALLEVLDSEQNCTFRDHYIEMPFDLSQVFFIATANTTDPIPPALLDRLEVIEMGSYTDTEKLAIAKNHLIGKQCENNGLKKNQISFTDEAVRLIITGYTMESGVRNLEREIGSVCRKVAKQIVTGEVKSVRVTKTNLHTFLGPVRKTPDKMPDSDAVGVVNGLAWTALGGELLKVEATAMNGTGKLELTGSLGDVMKESAKTAVSYIRKHSDELGVDPDFYTKQDMHIHVPEGAVPKDGPSAGVTLCTALVSELTHKPVRRNIAMTGELTLTGRVLPIGGLREKTMAAYKYGCDTVLIPFDNRGDVEELDGEVKEHLKLIPVKNVSEVMRLAIRS